MREKNPIDRFWLKVRLGADRDQCCIWTGATGEGYGEFWYVDRLVKAHRWAYETMVGPIPEGMQIDHLCRNPICVNPRHLEPVTSRENTMRGLLVALRTPLTHCPAGHEYSGDNIRINNKGHMRCVACIREQGRQFQRRIRRSLVGDRKIPVYSGPFNEFWAAFPRKVGKIAAYKEWVAWGCDGLPDVLPALKLQLPAFCQRQIDHIPHPATWVRQRRWEDEVIIRKNATPSASQGPPVASCAFHANRWSAGKRAPRPDKFCAECKHLEAANRARDSKVETTEDVIKRLGI